MSFLMAVATGTLLGLSVFLLMSRHLVRNILGIALLGHVASLFLFVSGGMGGGSHRGKPPIIDAAETVLAPDSADPLPQALILTAIVIGLGIQAFLLFLVARLTPFVREGNSDLLVTSEGGEEP